MKKLIPLFFVIGCEIIEPDIQGGRNYTNMDNADDCLGVFETEIERCNCEVDCQSRVGRDLVDCLEGWDT